MFEFEPHSTTERFIFGGSGGQLNLLPLNSHKHAVSSKQHVQGLGHFKSLI